MTMSRSSALWYVSNGRAAAPALSELSTAVSTSVKSAPPSERRSDASVLWRISNTRRVSSLRIRSR